MKTADLHVHSLYSDGTLTPKELIDEAKKCGLSAIALTDHDTIDGIEEAIHAAALQDMELIPGVELSCSYGRREIHILGLCLNHTNAFFIRSLDELKFIREERNKKIISSLQTLGMDVSYTGLKELYGNAVITRAHFAAYLLHKGYVKSRSEAFDRFLAEGKSCYVPREKITPGQAIRLIHDAKGISVLAHPLLYHMGAAELEKMIRALCCDGLDGIEAIYSTHSIGEEAKMRRLARENRLIISGGSDYHGENKPHIRMGTGRGNLQVPYSVPEKIKEYARRFS